jgi:hypothetical protein
MRCVVEQSASSPSVCATFLAGIVLAALEFPACARPPAAPLEIPFDFRTHQPIVQARVNGGPPVPFMVDTGSTLHLIDDGPTTSAGLSPGKGRKLYGGGEAGFDVRSAGPLRLEANGVIWEGQRASVMHLDYPEGKHFAGILGAPILMRYAVQFDFEKRVIRLFDPAAYRAPEGAAKVPFELQDDLPVVRVIVDAGTGPLEARLMVDTGGDCFVDLNRPFVDAHRLVTAAEDAAIVQRPGLGGTASFLYREGRRATLGGSVFEKPELGLSRARSGSSASDERDGILCNGLLAHFRRVTVDYDRRILVLEK